MAWRIELTDTASRALQKLNPDNRRRIIAFLKERVATSANPRDRGKALQGELYTYRRYRVGAYRLVCRIKDETVRVLVVRIGHRKDVYRQAYTAPSPIDGEEAYKYAALCRRHGSY